MIGRQRALITQSSEFDATAHVIGTDCDVNTQAAIDFSWRYLG
jgi:hypothetical protein